MRGGWAYLNFIADDGDDIRHSLILIAFLRMHGNCFTDKWTC